MSHKVRKRTFECAHSKDSDQLVHLCSLITFWIVTLRKQAYSKILKILLPKNENFQIKIHRGRQHSFVEIDHEIFSKVILSLPLIKEGQLSVSGERMCTILVNRLED